MVKKMIDDTTIGRCSKIYCNTCKGETNHDLEFVQPKLHYELAYEDTVNEQIAFWEKYEYRLWVCRGCDTATLEEAYTHMGMFSQRDNEEHFWESKFFPQRQRTDLSPKHFRHLNIKLSAIYLEVISSFNAELSILCAIGLRALLEGICADKGIKGRNLYEKVEGLKLHLPGNIVNSLHGFRFMGNDAAHELLQSEKSQLLLAIDIIEDLLNFLYDLEYKASGLLKRRES